MSKVSQTTIRVRYQETDQMGVVYHSNYFVWFEVGRTSLIREIGVSYRELEAEGIILPVIEAHCRYKAPARYEDVVRVATEISDLSPAKICFAYRIVREADDQLLAEGTTLHMWTSPTMKPVNLKRKWPDVYTWLQRFFVQT